jgi:hypothetical protein
MMKKEEQIERKRSAQLPGGFAEDSRGLQVRAYLHIRLENEHLMWMETLVASDRSHTTLLQVLLLDFLQCDLRFRERSETQLPVDPDHPVRARGSVTTTRENLAFWLVVRLRQSRS